MILLMDGLVASPLGSSAFATLTLLAQIKKSEIILKGLTIAKQSKISKTMVYTYVFSKQHLFLQSSYFCNV